MGRLEHLLYNILPDWEYEEGTHLQSTSSCDFSTASGPQKIRAATTAPYNHRLPRATWLTSTKPSQLPGTITPMSRGPGVYTSLLGESCREGETTRTAITEMRERGARYHCCT